MNINDKILGMNIENLSKQELRELCDMTQDIYSDIMVRYQLRLRPHLLTDPENHHDISKDELREKGFVMCGILVKLIKTVHEEGLCKNPHCITIADQTYQEYFRKEHQLEDWWAKRLLSISHPTEEPSPQSDSSSQN